MKITGITEKPSLTIEQDKAYVVFQLIYVTKLNDGSNIEQVDEAQFDFKHEFGIGIFGVLQFPA